jgi:hypothetical protein
MCYLYGRSEGELRVYFDQEWNGTLVLSLIT